MRKLLLYLFVFFSGFANLATEIIGPRLFASLFGSTTVIWAIIISVTLIGISLGYYLAGRIPKEKIPRWLPIALIVNAIWLLLISWVIWELPPRLSTSGPGIIMVTALIAFFVPAVIFSLASPLVITMLSDQAPHEHMPRIVGNVLALGTFGSVLGALAAAFILIPYVGLSTSLRIFALGSALFAIYFISSQRRLIPAAVTVLCLFFPLPTYRWSSPDTLLAQREGYYQTVRIYSDGETYIRLHLGPQYESEMNLVTGEPNFNYAQSIIDEIGPVEGQSVLIIGGAGHTMARALERRGASVTEVEIDPLVISLSNLFFGPIQGEVIEQDGRTYINQAQDKEFDYVIVDAYSGPASVPPQLTTQEFFEGLREAMAPDGVMLYNLIGIPDGEGSSSFKALSATLSSVFTDARFIPSSKGKFLQNIILLASMTEMSGLPYADAPCCEAQVLTDDLNPMELFLEEARQGEFYFRR
jgi:spermidine synthase